MPKVAKLSFTPEEFQRRRQQEMDAEANAFAFALLMPEDLVRAEVARVGGIDIENDEKLTVLAKKFRVSLQVAAIRLGQLYGLNR